MRYEEIKDIARAVVRELQALPGAEMDLLLQQLQEPDALTQTVANADLLRGQRFWRQLRAAAAENVIQHVARHDLAWSRRDSGRLVKLRELLETINRVEDFRKRFSYGPGSIKRVEDLKLFHALQEEIVTAWYAHDSDVACPERFGGLVSQPEATQDDQEPA